jgi:hypothetical protein
MPNSSKAFLIPVVSTPSLPWGAGGGLVVGGQTLESNKSYIYDLNSLDPGGILNLPANAADGDEITLTRISTGASAVIYTLTAPVGSIQDELGVQAATSVLSVATGRRMSRWKYQAAQMVWYVISFYGP